MCVCVCVVDVFFFVVDVLFCEATRQNTSPTTTVSHVAVAKIVRSSRRRLVGTSSQLRTSSSRHPASRTPPRPQRAPRITPPLIRQASLRPRSTGLRNQQRNALHTRASLRTCRSPADQTTGCSRRAPRRARLPRVRRRREIARREERRELRPPEGAVLGHVDGGGPAEAVAGRTVFHLQPRRRGGRRGVAGAARAGRGPTPRGARTRYPRRPWARRRP